MRREIKPLLENLERDEGFTISNLTLDILFSYVFTGLKGFYANEDYT